MINILSSADFSSNKEYKTIKSILERMSRTGVIYMGAGHCIGMSDLLRTALKQNNIKSRIVEVTLAITNKQNGEFVFIGFNEICKEHQIDTHVVVVTETEPPFLIDASVTNNLDGSVIVEPIPPLAALGTTNTILDVETGKYNITYNEKLPHVALLYQESIMERIKMDKEIFMSIKHLKQLNYVGIILSVFAVIAVINQIFRWFV